MDGGTVTITFKGDDKQLEQTTEKVTKNLEYRCGTIEIFCWPEFKSEWAIWTNLC